MLASDGRTLLLDFGLALVDGASRVTRSGIVPGTLAYMAPEALSESTTDPRSDLYSLAAVLYEMVTGAPPHAAQNREALLYAKLNLKPRKASELRPDVSEALDSLLARTLARDPGQRPADAEEFMNELRDRPASAAPVRTPRSAGELLAKGDGVVYLGVPAFDCDAGEAPALLDLGLLLAAALRRRLGSVRRMHVVQAGEPLGASGDVLDWATRHGANLVLHARARQQGSRVRIECALLDPAGGVALAGEIVE